MKFTPQELSIINISIQLDGDTPRQFALAGLMTATSIFKKLKDCTQDNKFIESEVNFTSEENVFIKGLIESSRWTVADGESVTLLLDKIK